MKESFFEKFLELDKVQYIRFWPIRTLNEHNLALYNFLFYVLSPIFSNTQKASIIYQ